MNLEERLRKLVFHGMQEFGGVVPAVGLFTDPVTKSSFSIQIDHQVGPALDTLRRTWDEEIAEDAIPDHDVYACDCESCQEWRRDLEADRALDSARER